MLYGLGRIIKAADEGVSQMLLTSNTCMIYLCRFAIQNRYRTTERRGGRHGQCLQSIPSGCDCSLKTQCGLTCTSNATQNRANPLFTMYVTEHFDAGPGLAAMVSKPGRELILLSRQKLRAERSKAIRKREVSSPRQRCRINCFFPSATQPHSFSLLLGHLARG